MSQALGADVNPDLLIESEAQRMAAEATWWQEGAWLCFKYGCLRPYRGSKRACKFVFGCCCRTRSLPTSAKKKRSD